MRIRLIKRLGQNQANAILTRSDTEASWLIQNGFAVHAPLVAERRTEPTPVEPEGESPGSTSEGAQGDTGPNVDGTESKPSSLAELKARAEQLGLPTYGTKAQLQARIDGA